MLAGLAVAVVAMTGAEATFAIHVDQAGYPSGMPVIAMLALSPDEAAARSATLHRIDGKFAPDRIVAVEAPQIEPHSGDRLQIIRLPANLASGEYRISVTGKGESPKFAVGREVYRRPFRLAVRSFTGQRCGTAVSLAPDFPEFKYPACHLGNSEYHASSGKSGPADMDGGWHDAGDYGKYIVNSGITTGQLLWAYEWHGSKLRNLDLDIPESGGKIPDFLDEVKWNLDWMLKMQDADGGVWHKATTANFPGMIMPQDDKGKTLVIGNGKPPYKTTASTADFAAVMAIAARVYRPFDSAYADRCLAAAERGWKWLEANPDNAFTRNPEGISTGGYGDDKLADERLWAAAELFRTTRAKPYNDYFLANYAQLAPLLSADYAPGWGGVQPMAMGAYAMARGADRKAVAAIRASARTAAEGVAARIESHGYRMPLKSTEYYWGSNSVVANYGFLLLLADKLDGTRKFRPAAAECLHYLFGRNPFGTSYVTQVGTKWAMRPHNRPSHADGIDQPWPGLLMGGPNSNGSQDKPMRAWVDRMESYDKNENAINWNAALVFLLADFI